MDGGRPLSPTRATNTFPAPGRRPSSFVWPTAVALLVLGACLAASLGLTLAWASQRLDLVHAAVFNVCRMRTYAVHWQNKARLPRPLNYDFTKSPESFVLVEVWIADGPTLSFSQRLPSACQ